jgi:hypothetical protein
VGTRDHFYVHAGRPEFDVADDDGTLVHHALSEVRPGLFLADDGETLDLTGRQPRWANLRLVKVSGPRAWEWLVLGGAAAVAATWLVLAGRRVVRARRRGRPIITPAAARRPTWPRIAAAAGTLTALGVIATVSLIKALPGLVSSGFVGWLDLPTPIRLALHLPLALACLTASTLGLAAWGWRRAWWSLAQRLQYVALGTAAGVLVLQVASWHLIGWGYR